VLCPNTAIQAQWMAQWQASFGPDVVGATASRELPTPLTVLTYQLLELWGRLLQAVIGQLDKPRIVGLTATPPHLMTAEQAVLHRALFGRVDLEVSAPALVREGLLAPYQELAFLTRPSPAEADYVHGESLRFAELRAGLLDPSFASVPFLGWLQARMVERRSAGGHVACGPEGAERLLKWLREAEPGLELAMAPWGDLAEITGAAGWEPRRYVPLVTRFHADGGSRCLIGTRALLGEGWDAPAVNVVIDLTAATTPTSVVQARGRALRLDAGWPGKVADNWSVVCVTGDHPKGAADFDRFARKHDRYFALAQTGDMVSGVAHVDPRLSPYAPPPDEQFDALNATMLRRAGERDGTRERWAIGTPFADEPVATVTVATRRPLGRSPDADARRRHPAGRGEPCGGRGRGGGGHRAGRRRRRGPDRGPGDRGAGQREPGRPGRGGGQCPARGRADRPGRRRGAGRGAGRRGLPGPAGGGPGGGVGPVRRGPGRGAGPAQPAAVRNPAADPAPAGEQAGPDVPGSYPARVGGPWLCRTFVLSLFHAVVVPSALTTRVQPHRWITTWWWNEQRSTHSFTDVFPPSALCFVWCTSQAPAGWLQPPAHWQCRSRSMTALRIPAGTVSA
jgi:hypothetical protein